MEKRNFVTAMRTPKEGADEIDEILEAGKASLGCNVKSAASKDFEMKASVEDEKSDQAE